MKFTVALLGALSLALLAPKAPAQEAAKPTVWLIGDSTVNNGTKGQQGWGSALPEFFDTSKVTIQNKARGGRSSRTYFTEGLWDGVLKDIKPGDFVLMQFGHNDGGANYTGDRGRSSLKGNGEDTKDVVHEDGKTETVHTFGWYERRYITDAKAKGATPIVLSLVPRNRWNADNTKVGRSGGDYGGFAKEAAEQTGALFIDLNTLVADQYDALGKAKVDTLFFNDWTHTNPEGAHLNARTVAKALRDTNSPLAPYVLAEKVANP